MKMKVKLIKEFNAGTDEVPEILPVDSVIEVDVETGNQLIADEFAIEYTEEEVKSEEELLKDKELLEVEEEVKRLKLELKGTKKIVLEDKKMNVFGKSIKAAIETKATGMTGASVLAGTDATDVLGVIAADSIIFGKARKMPISGNLNVIYSKGATSDGDLTDPTILPMIGVVGEGTAGATTVPIGQYQAIPGKWFATVAITQEMLEDVPSLEAFVIQELRTELGIAIDNSALNGTFTNSIGLKGVVGDTNALSSNFADEDAPTLSELTAMTAKINPMLHGVSEWYINPTTWGNLEGTLLTANNIANQLIKTGKEKELLGFPVNISFAVPSLVFGDFGQYMIGVRKEIEITRDDSVLFNTDEAMIKIRIRLAGGLAAGVRSYEGSDYASIVYAAETSS